MKRTSIINRITNKKRKKRTMLNMKGTRKRQAMNLHLVHPMMKMANISIAIETS
jgi:hypothetical protein